MLNTSDFESIALMRTLFFEGTSSWLLGNYEYKHRLFAVGLPI